MSNNGIQAHARQQNSENANGTEQNSANLAWQEGEANAGVHGPHVYGGHWIDVP